MSSSPDHLYKLLPALYRQRDEERNLPLQALLQVIGEQVDVVEEDISQLYENWFIETCQDWIVPYIGDLIGYRPVHEAGEPGDVDTPQGQQLNKILIPRREVANTIRYRRGKGTLPLLELLARDVAGWPARAVEFYKLLGLTQAINHPRLTQGQTVDLRRRAALDHLDGPFDELAHTVDVRRITSHRTRGRYNIPTIGLFVWRLRPYSITKMRALYREKDGPYWYTFSILGNDNPLYTRAEPEAKPTQIAGELDLPIPISRRAFKAHKSAYYGEKGKSLGIWVEGWEGVESFRSRKFVPEKRIVLADLTDWHYQPSPGTIAVDPESGRIAFHRSQLPRKGVWVSYHYGFSADIGGGEYDRTLLKPPEHAQFDKDDFKEPVDLASKLQNSSDPVHQYLRQQLPEATQRLLGFEETQRPMDSEETQQSLEDHSGSDPRRGELQEALASVLNRLLKSGSLYDQQCFDQVIRAEDAQQLSERDLRERELILFNRWCLERAYPDEIAKGFALYCVSQEPDAPDNCSERINDALERWRQEKPRHAIVEIADSGVYGERISISLEKNQTLHLCAANRQRPVIRLLDYQPDLPDALSVTGKPGSRFTLDGLLVAGHGVSIEGGLASVTIRHSTLVPGWSLLQDCEPRWAAEPSLTLSNTPNEGEYIECVNIEHSIIGSIQTNQDEVRTEPVRIEIVDSILDATSPDLEALGSVGCAVAHARLKIARSTVFGRVEVHAIDLAENSILEGCVRVARRQWGCMRFCYVTPGSRTPSRYNCQPDLVEQIVKEVLKTQATTEEEKEAAPRRERERVRPRFNSVRYGTPAYCQLAEACAEEIKRGADDESEMGAFHDLFQPQREANLRARLDEYTPAGTEAGIIFAS
jgi:hypothetical protein